MKTLLFLILIYSKTISAEVIIPNTFVVENVLEERAEPQPEGMPRQVDLSKNILSLTKLYSDFVTNDLVLSEFGMGIIGEISNLFRDLNKVDIYAVKDLEELNTFCASGDGKVYVLPDGAQVSKVACTAGNETYLVEGIFKRMTLHQQVLLLMHERLTLLKDQHGGKNYKAIAAFTSGLGKIIEIGYREQSQQYLSLTDIEKERVRLFYDGVIQLIYRNGDIPANAYDWSIVKNGGGIIKKDVTFSSSAFLSVKSVVLSKSEVADNSIIINSIIPAKSKIEENVEIRSMTIQSSSYGKTLSFRVGKNSQLTNSKIAAENIVLGADSIITDSDVCSLSFLVGNSFVMERSHINFSAHEYSCWLNKSPETIRGKMIAEKAEVVIGSGEKLVDAVINSESSVDYAPIGMAVNFKRIELKEFKTSCYDDLIGFDIRTGKDIYPCFEIFAYPDYFEETITIPSFPRDNGLKIDLKHKIETKTFKKRENDKIKTFNAYLAKSFSFAINALPMPAGPSNYYLVHNQKIVSVGELRTRKFNYAMQFWAGNLILEVVRDQFKLLEVQVEKEEEHLVLDIYYPY